MARGRMVNATIATDKRLADLPLEAELLYLKTIPQLDRDGLILGDPAVLWAKACPRRPELLPDVEAYVNLWIASGLVIAYDTADGVALFFVNFAKNQTGMRYDREGASTIMCPPGFVRTDTGLVVAELRSNSGATPEPLPVKLNEVKSSLSKEKINEDEPTPGAQRQSSRFPKAAQVFIDNGGSWPTGRLADGSTKKANAIKAIAETVGDKPKDLDLWGKVVAEYCRQWSGKSYAVMLKEYYSQGKIPGEANKNGTGKASTAPPKVTEGRRRAYTEQST